MFPESPLTAPAAIRRRCRHAFKKIDLD